MPEDRLIWRNLIYLAPNPKTLLNQISVHSWKRDSPRRSILVSLAPEQARVAVVASLAVTSRTSWCPPNLPLGRSAFRFETSPRRFTQQISERGETDLGTVLDETDQARGVKTGNGAEQPRQRHCTVYIGRSFLCHFQALPASDAACQSCAPVAPLPLIILSYYHGTDNAHNGSHDDRLTPWLRRDNCQRVMASVMVPFGFSLLGILPGDDSICARCAVDLPYSHTVVIPWRSGAPPCKSVSLQYISSM